ncbi:MAG TPA: hypothetical protein VJA27_01105 [Patescibacteria group bacterium]|nr:hypothetical protein [Patescibacteria group bacterium]
MNNKTQKVLIVLIILAAVVGGYFYFSQNNQYLVKTSSKSIIVSDQKYKKVDDSETYARNFEAKEKIGKEAYPQVITVFLNTMSADRMSGKKISENEWLEMFVVHPQTVTVQIRRNKGDYWILSRQTFSVSEPQLINTNPESSEQNFTLYQNFFQNEIDTTRHVLDSEF